MRAPVDFSLHLGAQRGLSEHTSGPTSATSTMLLGFASRHGRPRLDDDRPRRPARLARLDGRPRAAAARRSPAGVPRSAPSSPGPRRPAASRPTRRSGSRPPSRRRPCPTVARASSRPTQLLDVARERAGDGDAVRAARLGRCSSCSTPPGVRVGELVRRRRRRRRPRRARLLRVVGKGDKERVVPFGRPGRARARTPGSTRGRPRCARPDSGPALFLGVRGGRARPAPGARGRAPGGRARRCRRRRAARAAAHRGHPPARRAAPTCAASRRSSVTRASRRRSGTPTSQPSACARSFQQAHPRA